MFNQVQILGYVGGDPEIRSTANGNNVANFAIATSERWTDKSGEKKEITEWHRCVVFGKTADTAAKYVHKGDPLFVTGRLRTEKFTDKEGIERQITKVYIDWLQLMPKSMKANGATAGPSKAPTEPQQADQFDDDIPF